MDRPVEASPLKLKPGKKRPRLCTDYSKCIKCQSLTREPVSNASAAGAISIVSAANLRKDKACMFA